MITQTKVQVVSDLHIDWLTEAEAINLANKITYVSDADYLVIAGDLAEIKSNITFNKTKQFLRALHTAYKSIIYIPGNHEYYGLSENEVKEKFDELKAEVINLVCSTEPFEFIEKDNGQILLACATGWYPYHPTLASIIRSKRIGDYLIKEGTTAEDLIEFTSFKNTEAAQFFASTNAPIWVMHHLPCSLCVDDAYLGHPLNPFFVAQIGAVLKKKQPQVLIHGHSHKAKRLRIPPTEVICNPYGYPSEPNTGFDLNCIFTIGGSYD